MVKFSVRRRLTVFVLVAVIIILGVVSVVNMTPDLLPNMDFPYVVIMTTYPGASPESVEAEVTKPLEQSMATLEHIKNITSTSSENYSVVMLEFEDSVNLDTVNVDIQQNISTLSGSWDDAVGTPYVLKINPSILPVEVAAVSMEGMDTVELSDFVEETVLPKLEGVAGVASVTSMGSVSRQLHVIIDQDKIDGVNTRMADAVNRQLDDSKAELEDTKAELEDAKDQLDSASSQLSSGKETLLSQTSAAEGTINQQQMELLEGKVQIQQQLVSLNETRTTIQTSLESLKTLQSQISDLESTKTELEDNKTTLENAIAELDKLSAAVEEADSAVAALQAQIDALTPPPAEEGGDQTETPADGQTETPADGQTEVPDATQSAEDAAKLAELQTQLAAAQAQAAGLRAQLAAAESEKAALEANLASVESGLASVNAGLETIDAQLAAQNMSRETLPDSVSELESSLTQVDDGISQLNDTLSQLESGSIQLSDALSTLSQSQSSGLLELADAAAEIAVNSATVNSALEQVDSGLDTIEDSRAGALDAADLSEKLSIDTVSSILSAQNFSMPAGYVEQDGVSYMVSVGDEITDEEELGSLLLFDTGEDGIGPVYLRDVAEIFVTDNSDESYAKLNGENGLILSFEKQSNAATADVTDNLAERFAALEEDYPGLRFVSLMNQGDYITIIISSILESLLYGALFAIIILLLFLRDIRPTVITLVSIPVSLMCAIMLMYFTGVTINMISLSGLAVTVGMLVDNSIVVIENIYRLRTKGATAIQAAVAGTKQVAGAITASTLTTVCMFLPIVFVQGLTRQLFTDLALTIAYSLLSSLLIAMTLVPAMARGMLRDGKGRLKSLPADRPEGRFYRGYRKTLSWSLDHKWVVLGGALALLIVSTWGALSKGFSYMPDIDMNTVSVTVTMPEDASRDEAVETADEVLRRIETVDGVETVGAMMGGSGAVSTGSSYDVTVYVTLPEGASGKAAGREIAALCDDLDCELDYDSAMMNMSYLTGSGVSINIYGDDMEELQTAARQIAGALAGVEGVTESDSGLEDASPALHVAVDKNAAMEKGYTVAQLYMKISAALTDSKTVMDMDMDGVTADVLVEETDAMTREELAALELEYTNADGDTETFRLDDVADIEDTVSLTSIRRDNQRRYMTVSAAVDEDRNVTLISSDVEEAVAALELPDSVSYEFAGENEIIMEAIRDLALVLVLGVILVYAIMVAQFQSFKSPFIVLFTIPLAFTGGFLALLLCGMDVSIISMIGFVMLTGVIVNNGIVLVDYVNQLREAGTSRRDALVEAGVTRMRPILMTTLTTVLGLVVMAFGRDPGTALMQPLAVVCIGGLLYATLMTLFVVPCIYDIMNRKEMTAITDEDMEYEEV